MALIDFIEKDIPRTLYPLETPAAFIRHGEKEIRKFLESNVFDEKAADGFMKASTEYALKDQLHTRRVFVLDAIATFFLYDFVWQNRSKFVVPRARTGRRFFGYGFSEKGQLIDGFRDYHAFRQKRYELKKTAKYHARADIFNCFNSFYHHRIASDLKTRTSELGGDRFGQFLREINAGDSVWCFPQGLYPAKVVGNHYLQFIEKSRTIESKELIRFLDDVYLFGRSEKSMIDDLRRLQSVLGGHYMALNDQKTWIASTNESFGQAKLDDLKKSVLQKRELIGGSYDVDYDKDEDLLSDAEEEYLLDLIGQKGAAPEDIELGLSLLKDSPKALATLVPQVVTKSPHLLRELHRASTGDGFVDAAVELLWDQMSDRIDVANTLSSHELFWYARILIDHYELNEDTADLLLKIAHAKNASTAVRAAILETDTIDFGLGEYKEDILDESSLGLLTYAALYGLRRKEKARRNQQFKYIGRAGPQWKLVTQIASKF